MKTICIGMDEQGQFFVGMMPKNEGENLSAAPMGNSMDPGSDSDYREESQPPEDYMQPVRSMAEAFQAARTMLTENDDADGQAQFDAGVQRVLGPNPKPQMGGAPRPLGGPMGGMKGGM